MTVHDLSIAVVCSSNQNRSMEAHNLLSKRGYKTKSYGSGTCVRLPGPSARQPNVYSFGDSYERMFKELKAKDRDFYTRSGLLNMLDRNKRIKRCPERFQDAKDQFDVIITCQEKVFEQVLEDLYSRDSMCSKPVLIVNVEIPDTHEDATLGAFLIHDVVQQISRCEDPEGDIEGLLSALELKKKQRFLYSIAFY